MGKETFDQRVQETVDAITAAMEKGELTGLVVILRGKEKKQDRFAVHGFSYLEALGALSVSKETIHIMENAGLFDDD